MNLKRCQIVCCIGRYCVVPVCVSVFVTCDCNVVTCMLMTIFVSHICRRLSVTRREIHAERDGRTKYFTENECDSNVASLLSAAAADQLTVLAAVS